MASFENKTVIVTGCSSGVGLATTRLFLSRKARVFGIDISPFKAELDPSQSTSFAFHQVNLTAPDAADTAVAACQARFGRRIDALANVAGIMDNLGSVDSLKDEDWDRVIAVNLTAPVRLMRAVIPAMREQKSGAIVNVGSVASISGGMSGVAYTASKHGIAGATKNVAWRYRFEGIRANCVLPAGVATNIQNSVNQETWDQEAMAVITPIHQLQGGGKAYNLVDPIEIAEAIVFLSSDQAKTVNGLMMSVDTGYCALG